jgi:hypothetical protein
MVRVAMIVSVAAVIMSSLGLAQATPEATPVSQTLPVEQLYQLTGSATDGAINDTAADYGVYGTDLGSSFLYGDKLYVVFGDTFGENKRDWRSNTLAVATDLDPTDGITFDRMIEDTPGHAKEILASRKLDHVEMTVIPTYGVAVGDRLYLHYMSVKHWGPPGQWELGSSGWAYSDDGGENWTKDEQAIWPGDSNFGQVAIDEADGYLYIYGIPGGRFGGVQLARVAPEQILDLASYEYWTGSVWETGAAERAATIVDAPVGELSVRWHPYYNKYVMMYLNEHKAAVVLRAADSPTGPWSDEYIVATGAEFPALYAPFQLPVFNDGPDIYFTMSQFGPYQVYLMKTRLE